jgi:hypothetical protein
VVDDNINNSMKERPSPEASILLWEAEANYGDHAKNCLQERDAM